MFTRSLYVEAVGRNVTVDLRDVAPDRLAFLKGQAAATGDTETVDLIDRIMEVKR